MTAQPHGIRISPSDASFIDVDFPPLEQLLVDLVAPGQPPGRDVERIVFLITKDHPERLLLTLPAIAASSDRLFVIDSSTGPQTRRLCAERGGSRVHYHGVEEQHRALAAKGSLRRALDSGFITRLSDDCWDIWSKRNYALLYACLGGFSNVLFIDDDIVPPTGLIGDAISLSTRHKLVGARVRGMADVSVVGHLSALHGLVSQQFVSGHFLAIDVAQASGYYFANLYNEDWLFVLLNGVDSPVARHGAIFQLYWNPYDRTEARASSEEFGEIVIEGLARALLSGDGRTRLELAEHWEDTLARRRGTLDALASSELIGSIPALVAILRSVSDAASAVTPEHCRRFWQAYQARLPEWRGLVAAAAGEGPPP